MTVNPDFNMFGAEGPQRLPQISIDAVPPAMGDNAAGAAEIYAAAWNIAQRDHELDKLFNSEFYGDEI